MGEDGEEGESSAASWGEDEQEAEKVEEKEKETPEMEKLEKMATKDPFVKSFEEMNKVWYLVYVFAFCTQIAWLFCNLKKNGKLE